MVFDLIAAFSVQIFELRQFLLECLCIEMGGLDMWRKKFAVAVTAVFGLVPGVLADHSPEPGDVCFVQHPPCCRVGLQVYDHFCSGLTLTSIKTHEDGLLLFVIEPPE